MGFKMTRSENMDKKSIYDILPIIAGQVGAVEKVKTTTGNGPTWKYRGIDDFLNALNPLLAQHGVSIIPEMIKRENFERVSKSGGLNFHSIITYKFTFYAPDGSSVSAVVDGEAMDTSDKASGKALSYALKGALISVFAVPTEDTQDTDFETHQQAVARLQPERVFAPTKEELKPKAPAPKDPQRTTNIHESNPLNPPCTPAQLEQFKKARIKAKLSIEDVLFMCKTEFSKEKPQDLTSSEMAHFIKNMEKKK